VGSSGDPDADAVMAQMDAPSAPASVTGDPDADAVLHSMGHKADPSLWDRYKGLQESQLAAATGGVAKLGGGLTYLGTLAATRGDTDAAKAVQEDTEKALTYQPRTETGQKLTSDMGNVAGYFGTKEGEAAGPAVTDIATRAGASPEVAGAAGAAANTALQAPQYLLGIKGLGKAEEVAPTARVEPTIGPISPVQEALNKAYAGQSMGAASSAPNIAKLSPDLQDAVGTAIQKGPINQDALGRHVEADSLPVPVQLTKGQALQDPTQLSNEFNMKLAQKPVADRFNEQNGKLIQNVQAIRDEAGPDVFSANPIEHGDTLIKAYKDKGAAADAGTSADYQALKDANGGKFPVDAPTLLGNATSALHQQLLFDHAPPAVMKTLQRLADSNNMSFENFESLRTNLARIQRTATDGNERAAAGVIRNAMEDLPLAPEAAGLKPLADKARASARAQFQALEADPAYKAAVNDTVPPDQFVKKFVINGTRDNVETMRANLAHDPAATQTMGVAAIDHLRQSAGVDPLGNGNFSQANFNKNLGNLMPKIQHLMEPEQAAQLETLGNVARYTQAQPRGSTFNNSGSGILVGQMAKGMAEHAANAAAKGFPLGTLIRKVAGNRKDAAEAAEALKPGAGIEASP
jgi:hypothetical protein